VRTSPRPQVDKPLQEHCTSDTVATMWALRPDRVGAGPELACRRPDAAHPNLVQGLAPSYQSAIIAVAIAISMWAAPSASAHGLPTLLATSDWCASCNHQVGVYRVRPSVIELTQAIGGRLRLRWSSWNSTDASGSGSGESFGASSVYHYRAVVRASDPVHGRFARLELRMTAGGRTNVEKLVVTSNLGPRWAQEGDEA
jgi:hypothetical protein